MASLLRRATALHRSFAAWLALLTGVSPVAALAGDFVTVEPTRIEAGSFYDGATLHVRGRVGENAQVAIRLMGPVEHHTFNRRGKLAGLVWGGLEHVTFEQAPSLYLLYTSAALGAVAGPAVRTALRLGYESLEADIEVKGTSSDKRQLIEQLVKLKESEGLYRLAPGAVHLSDPEHGQRTFQVAVPVPVTAAPGDIEVTVVELADGLVARTQTSQVELARVGMPAALFAMAHQQGVLFGLLSVTVLLLTGVGVDLLGSRRASRSHPAVVMLVGLVRGVDDVVLAARHRPRSPRAVEQMRAKYRLFRRLLGLNNELLENLAELEEESSWTSFRHARVRMGIRALFDGTADMVEVLNKLTSDRYFDLANVVASFRADVWKFLERASEREDEAPFTLGLEEIRTESAPLVGGKAASLARIECDLGTHIPEGFVVTVEGYREFLEHSDLGTQLRNLLAPARLDQQADFQRRCQMAHQLVLEAPVPRALAEAILAATRARGLDTGLSLAVRSSAAGESTELSFAGQFETVLDVPASGLVAAWKQVVASRFSPRAVFYRRAAGVADVDTPMAVLVQRMVPARASGVLFSRRPEEPKGAAMLISADRGLGPDVSAGVADADQLLVARGGKHPVLQRRIVRKAVELVGTDGGGVAHRPVAAEAQLGPAISDDEASALAATALAIERYFGVAQDIEWAIDADGRIFVLQARPLRANALQAAQAELPAGVKALASGGAPVWPGRAVGPVHLARTPVEEEATPVGALLVVPQLSPDCVRLLPRVCGIVSEHGTVTGHAASILREFRVPSVLGMAGALQALEAGGEMSLDVATRQVFSGALWPELRGRLPAGLTDRGTAGLPELLADRITNLSGNAFLGTWACQSVHDVIRFAHEMAIQAMFDIGDRLLHSPIGGVKRLVCPPPIYVHVVDLGNGLAPHSGEAVTPEQVLSAPFQALWRGLSDPSFEPERTERSGPFAAVLSNTMVTSGSRELGSPNYACLTDCYLNMSSRQAYHFTVVDSFLSDSANANHISIRLRGGGAASWQRGLRVQFAAEVLRLHHFTVSTRGDLLTGWVRGVDRATGEAELATVGHLLRYLSRLDMWMTDPSQVRRYFDAFVEAEARLPQTA
jgi:pyruvate,water dikinase